MNIVDNINTFAKIFLITSFIYMIYLKIIDCRKNSSIKYILITIVNIILSVIYIMLSKYVQPLIVIIFLYLIYGMIIKLVIKDEFNYIAYIFSCVISYSMHLISIVISGIMLGLLLKESEHINTISLLTIPSIFILLYNFIFTRERFKNGLNFFKSEKNNQNIRKFTIFWTNMIILLLILFQSDNNYIWKLSVIVGAISIIISIIIWTKRQVTKTYKNRMRDRTIEIQKTEIDEQTKLIEEIKAENLKLGEVIHKYNKKFSSLEFAMKNALELNSKTEFANEISVILKESEETLKNFAQETQLNTNKLPLTNITGIDNMFKYMQEEARKNNINFDLKINESIKPLMENTISKDKFETLIGDHLKDAIIAVNSSNDTYKSILVTLGLVEGIYELSIYDTGIEFEIDTLLKLGRERVTTHKQTGGSGIGFMTTFETLKQCKASLVIEEYNPETTNYTKSVTIRFDGKNQYKICSYRAEKIKEQKPKRRIIIQEMK